MGRALNSRRPWGSSWPRSLPRPPPSGPSPRTLPVLRLESRATSYKTPSSLEPVRGSGPALRTPGSRPSRPSFRGAPPGRRGADEPARTRSRWCASRGAATRDRGRRVGAGAGGPREPGTRAERNGAGRWPEPGAGGGSQTGVRRGGRAGGRVRRFFSRSFQV